jgi:hypothetical protein
MEVAKFTERLVPTTRFVAVNGVAPEIPYPATTFVAPNASVIGDVTLGKNSRYVWCLKQNLSSSSICPRFSHWSCSLLP